MSFSLRARSGRPADPRRYLQSFDAASASGARDTPRSAAAARAIGVSSPLRLDIQGLRAVAVVAVIADHVLGWPRGGFVGVDVFFVISGFLITGLLLREHDRTGRISFTGFYRRRVKRIMPAALLVLATTIVASFLVFNTARALSVLTDALWGLFFAANWRFVAVGTDYFQSTSPTSPLQHFWSLGVEEQFYFVWPWLMLGILVTLGRRNLAAAHRAVAVVLAVLTVASLGWALYASQAVPASAYFSTFTRAWELGVGALLAVGAARLARLPRRLRPVLGWGGLAVIVVSCFVVTDTAAFPAPWALLPVAGAAMVIAAGIGRPSGVWLLTNPVSAWLGELSYSLYLWHFPIVIVFGSLLVAGTATSAVSVLALTLAVSVLSFYLIENPIRRSGLLERRGNRRRPEREPLAQRTEVKAAAVVVIAALAAFTVAGAYGKQQSTAPSAAAAAVTGSLDDVSQTVSDGLPTTPAAPAALTSQLRSALAATSWPKLTPTLDSVIGGPEAPADIRPCGGTTPPLACVFGDTAAKRTVVVVGDSTAVAYTEMLRRIAVQQGDFRVVALGTFGCPFTDITIGNSDAKIAAACPALKARAVATIRSLKPDLVVVTDSYTQHTDSKTGSTIDQAEWQTGMTRQVSQFASAAKKVVFLSPPPSGADVTSCYTKVSTPSSCITRTGNEWRAFARAEIAAAKAVKGTWIDSRTWFCVQDVCPAFVGTTPVKLDLVHTTAAYDDKIAPYVASTLRKIGGV